MSATIIDGKAVAARVRAEVAEEVARMDDGARPRDRAGRRRPGLADLRRRQAQGLRRGRHRVDPPRPAGGHVARPSCWTWSRRLNADPAVSGIIVQLPVPEHIDAARVTSAVDPGQGRRRADADERGTARPGPRRPRSGNAVRRDGAAARLRHAARGSARGGGRAQRPGRQARRRAAARAERDRDDVPLPHPRPGRGVSQRGRAGRRRGPAAADHGRHGEGGRDSDRRRHEPHRRRPGRATSTSSRPPPGRGRSRRCRAAWAR